MPEVSDSRAFLDPDASREYLRSWKENVDRTAARAAMSEQMERLLTIDSAGVLVGLKLTDRIHRFEPGVAARAVMSALREARVRGWSAPRLMRMMPRRVHP